MSLSDNEKAEVKALPLVLEEHRDWFYAFMEYLFYAHDDHSISEVKRPTSFAQWVVQANRDKSIQPEMIEKLTGLHIDLFKQADTLSGVTSETRLKPRREDFSSFITVYDEFLSYVGRLETDLLLEGNGYDPLTGLRSYKMLEKDIGIELERFARQGKTFCVALARIDHFDILESKISREERDGYIRLISSLIKLSMRSFDDAYYLGNNQFVLSLKQTNTMGGISALERLKKELEQQKINIVTDDGKDTPLSMSCCVTEPYEGEDVSDMMHNLRKALAETKQSDMETVLEYHELSPLQRYIREGEGAV